MPNDKHFGLWMKNWVDRGKRGCRPSQSMSRGIYLGAWGKYRFIIQFVVKRTLSIAWEIKPVRWKLGTSDLKIAFEAWRKQFSHRRLNFQLFLIAHFNHTARYSTSLISVNLCRFRDVAGNFVKHFVGGGSCALPLRIVHEVFRSDIANVSVVYLFARQQPWYLCKAIYRPLNSLFLAYSREFNCFVHLTSCRWGFAMQIHIPSNLFSGKPMKIIQVVCFPKLWRVYWCVLF